MFSEETGKAIITVPLRIKIIKHGFNHFQNIEGPFLPTNNLSMNKTWFFKILGIGHGKQNMRSWLVYMPYKKSAFCFCCLLFSKCENQSSLEQESGFNHWKAPERMNVHENSKNHRQCFTQWKELERNLFYIRGIIDAELQQQIQRENQKWCDILKRLLHCIKYLTMQNLALRGHRESLQSNANSGNLLSLRKLVSNVDTVIKNTSTVRANLLEKIHKAKYYGLVFDSTPDLAHCEKMSEVVRYVEINFEQKTVYIKESFLGFIQLSDKDAASLNNIGAIRKRRYKCMSQCYDNAAVMAGH
ncbi:uncharacterized protein LOC124805983 [Hydra vulgaris]|uniref:uncharacterized protein LOC124805983 n=1 Tax=Hydra vulgaris TaxID=6087 RepID=UPI001F5F3DA1|nr:uncharacterized protein LOC124805983 [Hydra vulgaris]